MTTILVVMVCLVTTVIAVNQPFSPSSLPPLPSASSNNFIDYLQAARVPVTGLRVFTVPNALWNAREEIQFEVYRGNNKGTFVVLSYSSPAQAGVDAFKASYDQKFKRWNLTQISNVLVLASPDTVQMLNNELASHLTHFLAAPYRSFIPSATPGNAPQSKLRIK